MALPQWLQRIRSRTVFAPVTAGTPSDTILAVLYSRTAATLYLIYFVWSVTALTVGIPTVLRAQGDFGLLVFAILVMATSAPMLVGASCFPRLGRLELYASSAFVVLALFYLVIVAINVLVGHGALAGFVLISSVLVVPLSRSAFIFWTLLRSEPKPKAAA